MKKFTLILVLTPMLFFCQPGVNSSTEIVDVTNPVTGETWMDRNLGASQVATSSSDAASYGDLYQWGREADGHQLRNSGTTTTLSSIDQPAHGNFILAPNSPNDWRSPQNNNLWQGVNGVNNPCPSGYRLPTEAEWQAERQSWSTNNATGAFASPLKLPMAGYRLNSNGSLNNVGTLGACWSSTVSGTGSRGLGFDNNNAIVGTHQRADAASVRCLKDKILNVNDNPLQSTMVYPNPAKEVLNFTHPEQIKSITVYTIVGEKIFTTQDLSKPVDISFLNSGAYLVVIETHFGKETKKILKK